MIPTPKNILLVEDETLIAMSEARQIEKEGYTVLTAYNGEDAITMVKESPPDLILMDVDLGRGMDGTQASQEILREHDIPIVFLSSHTEPEVVEKTEKITSYGYVVKNTGITVLAASIKMAFKLHDAHQAIQRANVALAESEAVYHDLFNTSEVGMYRTRADGSEFLNANDKLLEIFGANRDEVIGKPSNIHWVDPSLRDELMRRLETEGRVLNFECQIYDDQDQVRDCITSMNLYKPGGILTGSILDVTETKRLEKELENALGFTQTVFEKSPLGILTCKANGDVQTVNPALARIVGGTIEKIQQQNVKQLESWKNSGLLAAAEKALATGEEVELEGFATSTFGKKFWLSALFTSFTHANEKYLLLQMDDITEHRQAEEKAARLVERLSLATRTASLGIWDWDIQKDVLVWDAGMYKLYGVQPGDFSNDNEAWFSRLHPEDQPVIDELVRRTLAGEAEYDTIYRIVRPGGEVRYIKAQGEVIRDAAGTPVRMVGVNNDITSLKQAEEKAARLVERLSLATRTADMGIWDWDIQTNVLVWDEGMYRMYGDRLSDSVGGYEAWISAVHPDDRAASADLVQRVVRGEAEYDTEFRMVRLNGEIRYIKAQANVIRDDAGTPVRLVGVNYDITSLKQAEEKAAGLVERLSMANRAASLGIWDWDIQKNTLLWDEGMYNLYGVRRVDFQEVYEAWIAALHPDDRKTSNDLVKRAVTGDGNYDSEFRIVRPDGEIRYVKAQGEVIRDAAGKAIRMIGVDYDITAHKQAEEKAAGLVERLSIATRAADMGVWDWDLQKDALVWDEGMYKLYGVAHDEFTGNNAAWASTVYPDDLAPTSDLVQRAIKGEIHYEAEFRIVRPSGELRYIKAQGEVIRDTAGNAVRMIGVNFDITSLKQAEEKATGLLERLSLATLAANMGVWDWDIQKDTLVWDEGMYDLYGVSQGEFTGNNEAWFSNLHPDDRVVIGELVQRVIAGEEDYDTEFRVLRPSGEVRYIKTQGEVIRDAAGTPMRMLGVNYDITQRKQAELALQASEERYRTILQTAMDGYWAIDLQGCIVDVNDAYCRMSGYSREELLGKCIPDLEAVESTSDTAGHIDRVKKEGFDRFETRHRRKDGSVYDVEVRVQFQPLEGGRLICFLRDITSSKQADERLRASEQHYRSLFENMIDGYAYCQMFYDEKGRPEDFVYLDVNSSFERLTGLKDVVGRRVTNVIPGIKEQNPELFDIYGRVASTGRPERFELDLKPLSFWLTISVYSPEKDCFVAVFENITERKQTEMALQEALASKETLMRELQHRVKNSLSTAASLIELEMDHLRDEDTRAIFTSTQNRIQTMATLFEQLNAESRVDQVDLRGYLGTLVERISDAYLAGGAPVRIETKLAEVKLEPKRAMPLGLIVNELVTNSLKYAFPAGRPGVICVTLEEEGGAISLSVTDDGVGMAESAHSRSGLGLNLVELLSTQLGGKSSVDGGPGTKVRVSFMR